MTLAKYVRQEINKALTSLSLYLSLSFSLRYFRGVCRRGPGRHGDRVGPGPAVVLQEAESRKQEVTRAL